MTCHESRERLSELLDEVLPAPERAEVDAHLADCPECRRELERLRATVSLLQRVEPVRAPAGFVDRVMAAVRPVPWYRRLAAWIFLPLLIKLPAEAAAMALVAILAVYLFQRDPELQRTVRPDLQATPPRAEAPAPREEQPASSLATPPLKAGKVEKGTAVERAREKFSYAERGAQDERAVTSPPSPPAVAEGKLADKKRGADLERLQKEDQAPRSAAPAASRAPRARMRPSVRRGFSPPRHPPRPIARRSVRASPACSPSRTAVPPSRGWPSFSCEWAEARSPAVATPRRASSRWLCRRPAMPSSRAASRRSVSGAPSRIPLSCPRNPPSSASPSASRNSISS